MIKYYSITIPQSILENECIEEILRERTSYESKDKILKQFWIMPTSYIFSLSDLYKNNLNKNLGNKIFKDKNNKYPILFTIVSTNSEFVIWLKIRLGSFLNLGKYNLINNTLLKVSEGIKNESFTSNIGFYNEYDLNSKEGKSINNIILKYNKNYIKEKS